MANFNFTVDTEDMAQSLHGVAPHVDGTTTAVVAMQTAVILAEKKAAEKICDNVDRGFFGLIRSQISQKLAVCQSQIDARLMELRQQSQELLGIQDRMRHDFEMITGRYAKLFRSLDAALRSRVQELDKPLLQFAGRDMEQVGNRARASQATLPIHQTESIVASQQLAVSQAKVSAARAIEGMHRFVSESNQQKALISSVLTEAVQEGDAQIHVPVAFIESDNPRTRQSGWNFHYPGSQTGLARVVGQRVEREILEGGSGPQWRPAMPEEKDRIYRIFLEMAKSSQYGERIRTQMIQLFNASKWLVPEKVGS
jgi:hypothetical protein